MTYFIYIGAAMVVIGFIMIAVSILSGRNKEQAETVQDVIEIESAGFDEDDFEDEEESVTGGAVEADTEEASEEVSEETTEEETEAFGDFGVNSVQEIVELITDYYAAYASGDTEKLEACASPVSELEKSYVNLMSEYTESTENIDCYIKDGLKEGTFAVSVTAETKLNGVDRAAPGLDFFYVEKQEDGSYRINNLYSSFNRSVKVLDMDEEVTAFIDSYEKEEDFMILQETVQGNYDEIIGSDEALKKKLLEEIPEAVTEWMNKLAGTESKTDNRPAEGTTLVAEDSFNVRDGMSDSSKKIGTVKKDTEFKVIKHYDGWTKIKWGDKKGYIKTELIMDEE